MSPGPSWRLPRVDRDGTRLRVGDTVRVVGIPPLPGPLEESRPVFEHILGTYRRIRAFDGRGCAEVMLRIRRGPLEGIHFVWLEPFLLKLRTRRLAPSSREAP
jgi:hypothetical protein